MPANMFQSSPAPKGGCYGDGSRMDAKTRMVSILTRPEGRMLRSGIVPGARDRPCFNPHPPRRADATLYGRLGALLTLPRFNPHPPRRADATVVAGQAPLRSPLVSILTRPEGRMLPPGHSHNTSRYDGFNPHPPRRADATADDGPVGHIRPVSILTRPEGRMLRHWSPLLSSPGMFQSSPAPKGGCYSQRWK